jgi:hypothetical protein
MNFLSLHLVKSMVGLEMRGVHLLVDFTRRPNIQLQSNYLGCLKIKSFRGLPHPMEKELN